MGNFTLGCLLGQYDRAQSFDISSKAITAANGTSVNSWAKSVSTSSAFFTAVADGTTDVHSSGQGLQVQVYSNASANFAVMLHAYATANDMYARWFPDVLTHSQRVDIWARMTDSARSGYLQFAIVSPSNIASIPYSAGMANVRVAAQVYSDVANTGAVRLRANTSVFVDCATMKMDDVIAQTDLINVYPEWSFAEAARAIQYNHRSLGGTHYTHRWSTYRTWQVPLRFLSTSHANLINWWWRNNLSLAFTLDTSDTESIHTCRIVNDTQPIGARIQPRSDMWTGMLELEALDGGSLVF